MSSISRRKLIAGTAALSGIAIATRIAGENNPIPPDSTTIYGVGHTLTYAAQRLLTGNANAREFSPGQISKTPHPKGRPPKGDEFPHHRAEGFKNWQLTIDGLVSRPASFSIPDLKSYPSNSQITQMICEEGWSYIAKWTGVPLSHVLSIAGVLPQAKYLVYYAMGGRVEAIDMQDAWHAQTLISYGMNSAEIPVGHGGPLRLRVPKQLGYKNLKFLTRISLTDNLEGLKLDKKYSWYAGI